MLIKEEVGNPMEKNTQGYVYVLEVKDIDLPVCKIGMTTRTPDERCNEINNSSTGDFIWSVSNYIAVDNCKALESLVHKKLEPVRQKRREFFNIYAEDGYKALLSIFNSQSEINVIEVENITEIRDKKSATKKKKIDKHGQVRKVDSKYSELLQSFSSVLNVKGKPFGQLNRPIFGMSDGNKGVQWNIAVYPESGEIRIGVNLEGSEKMGKWLISPFILSKPDIEEAKANVKDPNSIFVRFTRDAWQGASRLEIIEKYLGGREFSLFELNDKLWGSILEEALTCLDEARGYKRRKTKQIVTLKSDGRTVEKDISPHITIWSLMILDGDITETIENKIFELQPVYNWLLKYCQS